ncbi:uncharacterized protein PFL1_06548 [Pseudozyma flocculosa PF-1]|uniref:Autophagy-related protein 11 n=2 Tax=Pseudozyma flocculosa TaxID=84751 RepID=A0A5C3F964_9BASI|nr:uncharacterized protein PFL1_06548 [Pseudozyma flocculosa PF-1]EPQ25874.1 hypothetical protein PFL1_06548 [Pseudozyma flocculosa PF-1]SPO40626.1 related to ATG11 - required for mitophagy [Pseudozyma flocculosa]
MTTMKVIRAHDGRSFNVNQPLAQFHTLDDLLDCLSLATEIPSDAIICMTADGSQLKDDVVEHIARLERERGGDVQQTPASQPKQQQQQQQQQSPPPPTPPPPIEFFVFNRDFLYTDAEALAAELADVAELAPAVGELEVIHPPTPKSLEALVAWSNRTADHVAVHESRSRDLVDHIRCMLRSTQVALLNLRSHSDSIRRGADALAELATTELARMQGLLDGHERDLRILSMVAIHPRLLSAGSSGSGSGSAHNQSSTAAGKERHLGDYVSRVKMNAVADACARVYSELRDRITALEESRHQLDADTEALSREVEATDVAPSADTLHEASEAAARAAELLRFIDASCSPNDQGWPATYDRLDDATYDEVVAATDELVLLDDVARQSALRLVQDRNDMLARCLELLQDISSLQSEFADLGAGLAAVDADLHSNKVDGFKHLHRLKNMLWAYGATVLEVVRRREFARHFLSKSQALAELMAKLSATERKRRQRYRSNVFGQLPWEVKGMEELAPALEITTARTGGSDGGGGVAELGREDLEALLQLLDAVERRLVEEEGAEAAATEVASPIQEVKVALQRLMVVLDDWEGEFAFLVHTQLLGDDERFEDEEDEDDDVGDLDSGSDTSMRAHTRQRARWARLEAARGRARTAAPADRTEIEALERQLQDERDARKKDEEAVSAAHRSEIDALRAKLDDLGRELAAERAQSEQMVRQRTAAAEAERDAVRADLELERERRLNMGDELSHLRTALEEARRAEAEARQEAIEEGDHASEVEAHLHAMQVELDEARAARLDASNRIEALLSQGSGAEQELRAAQQRIDELTEQVTAAHAETSRVRETVAEIEAAKERQIRSHRAEADGDRAILEEKVRALEHDLHDQRIRTKRAEDGRKPDHDAIELLRGQLRAADDAHEEMVKQMDQARELADQAEAARRDVETSRQQMLEAVRPLLSRSHQLRKAVRAMPALSSSSSSSAKAAAAVAGQSSSLPPPPPSSSSLQQVRGAGSSMALSVVSEAERQAAMEAFESDAEAADVDVTLEALRAFDPAEAFDEVRAKLDSLTTLIRKWQKAYKSSNEKTQRALAAARDKIAFRNFQPGDLALFLPTRNSTAKPWAAFNISFPHFFLRATGQLAEQLKTKEWIVARIVAITDQVATNGDRRRAADEASTANGNGSGSGTANGGDVVDGNPFQLAEGVRFYLLDVETWNGPSAAPPALRSRKSSAALPAGERGAAAASTDIGKRERGPERRKSDILPSRGAPISGASVRDEEENPRKDRTTSAAVADDAEKTGNDSKAFQRRASEGDRPSEPVVGLTTAANASNDVACDNEAEAETGQRPSTPPLLTPDGSPLQPAPPHPPQPGLVDATIGRGTAAVDHSTAEPQTPAANDALHSPPVSSERRPRSRDAHATSLSEIAANAAMSPTRSSTGPSALTRAIRASSPVSLRGVERLHNGSGGLALPRTGTGMGISGSSFGGSTAPPPPALGASTAYGGNTYGGNTYGGTSSGPGNGGGDGASSSATTNGSDSKRSAIMERAAALPAFGRASGRSNMRFESRRHQQHGNRNGAGGMSSAPASQTMAVAATIDSALAPANPFSQSPSAGALSSSLAAQPLRRTTLSQRTDAPAVVVVAEDEGQEGEGKGKGGQAQQGSQPPKVQRWTEPAVASAIPTRNVRRGSSTGRTSGFSITSSPSTGTMGSPRGLAGSLAGPPPGPTSQISTEQATGRSTLGSSAESARAAPRPSTPAAAAAASSPNTRTFSGSGAGFLSQTLGRFSGQAAGPPWSSPPPSASTAHNSTSTVTAAHAADAAAAAGGSTTKGTMSAMPGSESGNSPKAATTSARRRSRPGLDAVLPFRRGASETAAAATALAGQTRADSGDDGEREGPTAAAAAAAVEGPSGPASGGSSAASQMLRRVGGFL